MKQLSMFEMPTLARPASIPQGACSSRQAGRFLRSIASTRRRERPQRDLSSDRRNTQCVRPVAQGPVWTPMVAQDAVARRSRVMTTVDNRTRRRNAVLSNPHAKVMLCGCAYQERAGKVRVIGIVKCTSQTNSASRLAMGN